MTASLVSLLFGGITWLRFVKKIRNNVWSVKKLKDSKDLLTSKISIRWRLLKVIFVYFGHDSARNSNEEKIPR